MTNKIEDRKWEVELKKRMGNEDVGDPVSEAI